VFVWVIELLFLESSFEGSLGGFAIILQLYLDSLCFTHSFLIVQNDYICYYVWMN